MREESYYELLQVQPTADVEVIRAAYRSLARRYHPDQNPSPSAEATTKLLNEAWEVLSDPVRRVEYDRTLTNRSPSSSTPPPQPPNRPTPKPPSPNASKPKGDKIDRTVNWVIGTLFVSGLIILLVWAALAQS